MRFLGNKESVVDEIETLLIEKNLMKRDLTFFDAFLGTGSVSEYLKDNFNIIGNDLLEWCVVYSSGRILRDKCTFDDLGFDPIKFLNSNTKVVKGFFYKNYTPAESERMYFSEYNGGRIDYFREQIESWYKNNQINKYEYDYLLASLLESVSLVANVAGVYGAFLKHWDPRALKEIEFVKVNELNNKMCGNVKFYNEKIEEIIDDIECDVLYLDPPYTQNQYGTQYHLLETLIKYDDPSISKVTGSRRTAPMRSDWSKNYKVHILFDRIISKTKAKYILLSYSSDGMMSKQFIEAILKRYGKEETFVCKEIVYKKYRNWKTKRNNKHFEYLFYIEKKEKKDIIFESPLNYVGSKYKYMNQIEKFIPKSIDIFYDLFGGGFNVGINIDSKKIVYNDFNWIVKDLIKSFDCTATYDYLMYIRRIEKRFNLEVENKTGYLNAREHYNSLPIKERDPKFLFTLILYGFQQQIRFNSKYEFNNPSGNRWFNENVLEKLVSFSRVIQEKDIEYYSESFLALEKDITSNDFVYLDPPYMNTTGTYNDGKRGFNGWNVDDENDLKNFVDRLDKKDIKFMLSYVIYHKDKTNHNILDWVKNKGYTLIKLDKEAGRSRNEVLILNYEQ